MNSQIDTNTSEAINLDMKDRKILYELDMDARQPISQIAKKVRLSKETVNYRIKQLEKKGIIKGYYAALDLSKLGYLFCRIFLRFQNASQEKENEIINFCKKYYSIGWMYTIDGPWDLVFAIYPKNIGEIEQFCDKLIYRYGKFILNKTVSIATTIWHFKNNYLYEKKDYSEAILGEESKAKIDEKDIELLRLLAKNARFPIIDLAQKIHLSPNAIKYRIKNLVQNKIILAFRADININALGYEHYKVFLQLQNLDQIKLDNLIDFFRKNNNVIYITKPLGPADLEFEIILKNEKELHVFLRELRNRFDIVKECQPALLYNEIMLNYLP
jgi:Lrp/AsnC family leucine-responsive transcriptional regulator